MQTAILISMLHTIFTSMFQLPLPILEKLLRPAIVYLALVILLRIFGKRELAQLNPFDLVVLLSLSNTVQNAIIGDDNSVTGGIIGAFSLLAINWLVVRALFRSPRLTHTLEGRSAVLIRNGKVDNKALARESLTREELLAVVHRQGFEDFHQVNLCQLEPNGTFYIEAFEPSIAEKQHQELLAKLDALTREVAALRGNAAG
ncbi:MAG: YetF domain-containing protein [Terracidiphilus sp.]